MSNFYEQLGLTPGASPEEVKKAYRLLSKFYHPDKNQDPDAEQEYIKIQTAYETLGNPQKRWEYDQTLQSTQSYYDESRYAEHDPQRDTVYHYSPSTGEQIWYWVKMPFIILLSIFRFGLGALYILWQILKVLLIILILYGIWEMGHGLH